MNTETLMPNKIQEQVKTLFRDLPAESRIWIYQSNRELSTSETETIAQELKEFVKGWKAHGVPNHADSAVLFNRFLILVLDESIAGTHGCTIDSSIRMIQKMELRYQISLMNRLLVALMRNNIINVKSLREVKQTVNELQDAFLFDNGIATIADFYSRWLVPVPDSYLTRG